jgi:hypothetical protein
MVAMLVALGALAGGSPELARLMLDSVVWGVTAAVALAWIELGLWQTRRREGVAAGVA